MIVVNTPTIPGKHIAKVLGLVRGNTVRARHCGIDFIAFLKNMIGGEISEYTKLFAETREQSLDRMLEEASKLGANAVVNLRYTTCYIAQGAAELLAYGTAVMIEDEH